MGRGHRVPPCEVFRSVLFSSSRNRVLASSVVPLLEKCREMAHYLSVQSQGTEAASLISLCHWVLTLVSGPTGHHQAVVSNPSVHEVLGSGLLSFESRLSLGVGVL